MRTEESTIRRLDVAGLRTRCQVQGAGDPVLVLHGWGESIESIRPLTAAVAQIATACAVDMPGFGESEPPPEPWGTGEYAAFVRELMDTLGLEAAAVVGHSFGGRVAIRLAADFPRNVTKLVLVNSAGIGPKRKLTYHRRAALRILAAGLGRVGGRAGARLRARIV